jgi:hypothetical protein
MAITVTVDLVRPVSKRDLERFLEFLPDDFDDNLDLSGRSAPDDDLPHSLWAEIPDIRGG